NGYVYISPVGVPDPEEIKIIGEGEARVIGLIPGQIATESLTYQISDDDIPDIGRDILKVVVASRYDNTRVGVGLVHGLQMREGAIASSVAHDGHHLIAVGTSDDEILKVCSEVIRKRGGMACIHDGESMILPLSFAGLMAEAPYEEVYTWLRHLNQLVRLTGSVKNPFMYLSFLSLTVIPALRITPMGVFDGHAFAQVPLFVSKDT
ncbi:MAG: adenine deaminase, partial [Methanomicrobiales archaeon HGW-Methanomicrobiales-4]